MKRMLAILLVLVLAVSLFTIPALAAENSAAAAPEMQPISPWAYDALADVYALGLWSDDYYYCILDPVTDAQLAHICAAVAAKLALLNVAPYEGETASLVIDSTRGGVKNALYQEVAAYAMPYVYKGVDGMFSELGIARGDGSTSDIDSRVCSLQEALVLANRLVLALYDHYNAGSLGFLWKATSGGNTLYLLGTIHVDRGNVYPFHKQLRDVITQADAAIFELDLNDAAGMNTLALLQMYSDGSTLADHIDAALYAEVAAALAPLGLTEDMVAMYKPWALANTFQALAMMDDSTGESFMAVDSYVNAKAANVGINIGGVETYEFQGNIFDSLSADYQEDYLTASLSLYLGEDTETAVVSEDMAYIDSWMDAWKTRDVAAFTGSYDKDAYLSGDDELSYKLFAERDLNMTAAAAELLCTDGENTFILVVGAGHMVGNTGIVQGLLDLGYTVELVPKQ